MTRAAFQHKNTRLLRDHHLARFSVGRVRKSKATRLALVRIDTAAVRGESR